MKVVLDTNIFISAILFGGKPEIILNLVYSRQIKLIISEAILEELEGVLRVKFNYSILSFLALKESLLEISEIVKPKMQVRTIKEDPEDNMILEAAAAGKVDFIVSGDRHLLKLKQFKKIPIILPNEFLERIKYNMVCKYHTNLKKEAE